MQTLDVQIHASPGESGATGTRGTHGALHALLSGEKGAETARNGTSFLAIIQKMLAGSMEGLDGQTLSDAIREAGRGAGNQLVPGELNTLIKTGSAGRKAAGSNTQQEDDTISLEAALLSGQMTDTPSGSVEPDNSVETGTNGVKRPVAEVADAIRMAADSGEDASRAAAEHGAGVRISDAPPVLAVSPLQKADSRKDGSGNEPDTELKAEKTERRKQSAAISVRDERLQAENVRERVHAPVAETTVRDNGDGSADMSISFRADGSRAAQGTTTTSLYANPAADGDSFSALLAREVREGAQDFVRAGQIVLRDNNTGTIRLTLHPETLGNVRISLELGTDRKISGRIVVESKEAYDAFSENLDGLSDAFREGGFDTTGFNLSWSGKDQAEYAAEQQAASVRAPFYAQSVPDVMSEPETADRVMNAYLSNGSRSVNFFA